MIQFDIQKPLGYEVLVFFQLHIFSDEIKTFIVINVKIKTSRKN